MVSPALDQEGHGMPALRIVYCRFRIPVSHFNMLIIIPVAVEVKWKVQVKGRGDGYTVAWQKGFGQN